MIHSFELGLVTSQETVTGAWPKLEVGHGIWLSTVGHIWKEFCLCFSFFPYPSPHGGEILKDPAPILGNLFIDTNEKSHMLIGSTVRNWEQESSETGELQARKMKEELGKG